MERIFETIAAVFRELIATCGELPWAILDLVLVASDSPTGTRLVRDDRRRAAPR